MILKGNYSIKIFVILIKLHKINKRGFLVKGLFKYCRHPNYFGK